MMDVLQQLQGIIGVINTPFNHRNRIDHESLQRYVDHSLDCGVVGFLIGGMAAEINKLTQEEYISIARTVVNKVNGKVPVIGGTMATSRKERLLKGRRLLDIGIKGLLINIPFIDMYDYRKQVREIAKLNPEFIMIQDWDFEEYGLALDLIMQLYREIECFRSIKIEIVPAGVKYSQVLTASQGKLHVAGGWAGTQMIEALDRGVHAFMPTILHDVYGKIYTDHHHGKREEALQLFYQLTPILAFSHQHPDICIHFNKKLMQRQGIFCSSAVREPILAFDPYHERVAGELIEKALALSESCQSESKPKK
jgi:dihydrodipicolinate synthase/N-acetylneuraminate lyase